MEFRDLKKQYQILKTKIDENVLNVCASGAYIMDYPVLQLEEELAKYVGVKHCISCANGTDAMEMVLMGWGVKPNDAVFVPAFTFFATAEVVANLGATPIFIDVDERTFNIDCKDLESKIKDLKKNSSLNLKAIITVDLFGLSANYPEIEVMAKKYDLLLLEDSAQGFGGSIKDKKNCSFGDAATTSFFPSKPLGCYGDGGAIFTNDNELAAYLKSIRAHGKGEEKYDNVRIGLNSRLDTIQAAILLPKFDAFKDYELFAVNQIYKWYVEELDGIVKIPVIPEGYISSFAQFTIILNSEEIRNNLQKFLKEKNIPTMIYYPRPLHLQKAFNYLGYKPGDIPISEKLCTTVLSLPMHPYLSKENVVYVADEIKKFISKI